MTADPSAGTDDSSGALQLSGAGTASAIPPPAVTSIMPKNGTRGTTVTVTNLAGTGFNATGATVRLIKTGQTAITATNVMVVSPTMITCKFPIGATKAVGPWNVKVINPDGQSGTRANAFTVKSAAAPTVNRVLPKAGKRGTTVTVTNLTGTGFVGADKPTVRLTKTGQTPIMATNVMVVSPSRITCMFPIAAGKPIGLWNVTVINADGQSGMKANAFTVKSQTAPTVNGITPKTGERSRIIEITNLSGTGFVAADKPTVELTMAGQLPITATQVEVKSPTNITCRLPLHPTAAIGLWDVKVTNADGQSATMAAAFMVTQRY